MVQLKALLMNTFPTMYISFISPYMALNNPQGPGLIISLATWLTLGFNSYADSSLFVRHS